MDVIKYNNVDLDHIDIRLLNVPEPNNEPAIIEFHAITYNSAPLRVQTSYHCLTDQHIPKEDSVFYNIARRSNLKLNITPYMAEYSFYKRLDITFDSSEMREKLFGTNSHRYRYDPILNSEFNYIQFHLPYCRELKPRLGSYHGIRNLLEYDDYCDYIFYYSLYEKIQNKNKLIYFESFNQFSSYFKKGENIQLIIMPKIIVCNDTEKYYIRLDIKQILINRMDNIIFNYDYEYIFEKMFKDLRIEIHALRYKPENIGELINDNIITSSHLFAK